MPVPNKRKNEGPKKFMGRCMTDIPKDEFPDQKQRVAICLNQNKKKPKKILKQSTAVTKLILDSTSLIC